MAMGDYKIDFNTESFRTGLLNNSITYTSGYSTIYYPADFPINDPHWDHYEQPTRPTYPSPFRDINPFNTNDEDIAELKKELKKLKKKLQNKEIPMKNLYNVVVVSNEEKILLDEKVVASDREEATFNAGVHDALKEAKLKPKDVSILVNDMGQVRVKKEPQKMIVVKEEESKE